MTTENENATEKGELSLTRETNWLKVLFQIQCGISAFCAIHFLFYDSYWTTIFFTFTLAFLAHLGVAAGAHRLWAHNTYTATGPLKFFLVLFQTISGTGTVYDWVRWHRLHHKHFGTDMDPYNPSKGWFFAHFQSLTLNLSPAQEKALEEIDMSDIENEKMLMFQKKWYPILYVLFVLLLPINAPAEYWGEEIFASLFLAGWLRYSLNLQLSALIHSATRIWGLQPGEKYPCDTNLVFILTKSNWLSYHYMVPWDYKTGEFGQYGTDTTTKFIRVCEALDIAWNLSTVDSATVRQALAKSVKEKKDISECIRELSIENNKVQKNDYLNPTKAY